MPRPRINLKAPKLNSSSTASMTASAIGPVTASITVPLFVWVGLSIVLLFILFTIVSDPNKTTSIKTNMTTLMNKWNVHPNPANSPMYLPAVSAVPVYEHASLDPVADIYYPPEKRPYGLDAAIRYKNMLMPPSTKRAVPYSVPYINLHTRGINDEYQQIGILTSQTSDESLGTSSGPSSVVTPLMGRRAPAGNSKWQYFTMFNGSGMIPVKLPVTSAGKLCADDRGCEELQTGDVVAAEGYGSNLKVTIYRDSTIHL